MRKPLRSDERILIGALDDERTTHALISHVLDHFGATAHAVARWKGRGFPAPKLLHGVRVYPKAEIELWVRSDSAPAWVQGKETKSSGLKSASYEAHLRASGQEHVLSPGRRLPAAPKLRMDYERVLEG